MAEKIRIDNVRLSFPDLFNATDYENDGKFKYRATFIVEPGSAADKKIDAAINAVMKEEFKDKASAFRTQAEGKGSQGICYYNGDLKEYDGYAGNKILSTAREVDKARPGVYDKDRSPLAEADGKPYAGCYVNAVVEVWAQNNKFGKTARATLVSVQFAGDGDAFSSGSKPNEDDFDDLSDVGGGDEGGAGLL